MKTNDNQTEKVNAAYKKVEDLRSIYLHILTYITVNAAIFLGSLNGFGLPDTFWKTSLFVTGVFGAMGVIGQWAYLIGYRLIFPEKKEQELIEKFIKEDKKNTGV
ncbi:2TM domain-containing protein [Flavobacterium psychrotrophum]|uniref:2TM domain-containing protein n=1 Tax=Flavobacterium psychrotrophum TaxID=2294119 RepID=UPI000E323112|nr:2TM domain-containing protein [Flavobacterium psychrotrophum]